MLATTGTWFGPDRRRKRRPGLGSGYTSGSEPKSPPNCLGMYLRDSRAQVYSCMDLKGTARHALLIAAKDAQIRRAMPRGRCTRDHVHPGSRRRWAALEEIARWCRGTMTA